MTTRSKPERGKTLHENVCLEPGGPTCESNVFTRSVETTIRRRRHGDSSHLRDVESDNLTQRMGRAPKIALSAVSGADARLRSPLFITRYCEVVVIKYDFSLEKLH